MSKYFVVCGKHSAEEDIEKIVKSSGAADSDAVCVIGGLTEEGNREKLFQWISKRKYTYYIIDQTDLSVWEYLYCMKNIDKQAYKSAAESAKRRLMMTGDEKILDWAKKNAWLLDFYQKSSCEKYVFRDGFTYHISNGSLPLPEADKDARKKEQKDLARFDYFRKIVTAKPDYKGYYHVRLNNGEVVAVDKTSSAIPQDVMERKDERYVVIVTAHQETGKLLKKGVKDFMPVIDAGNVINIYTGGTRGSLQNEMKPVISSIELGSSFVAKIP